MNRRLLPGLLLLLALVAGLAAVPFSAGATEIWSGRTFSFTKPAFANPTLPASQDRISTQVWITRGNTQGIFNIHLEALYTNGVSPTGTEWATGDAVNHASLTFAPWSVWSLSNPPATIGVNAVVHLIAEDIYVDIVFDTWGIGATGGFFSYRRGVPPVVPTKPTSWGRIKTMYR